MQLCRIERMLSELTKVERPGVTITYFCQRVGISQDTAHHIIRRGELRKEPRKIPYSEPQKYRSCRMRKARLERRGRRAD